VGRLVDTQGRAIGVVPINIWDDSLAHDLSENAHTIAI
jgi:hypothetical protein